MEPKLCLPFLPVSPKKKVEYNKDEAKGYLKEADVLKSEPRGWRIERSYVATLS